MKQLTFDRPPGAWPLMLRVTATAFKRAPVVEALSAVTRVLPEVGVHAQHVDTYRRLCGFPPEGGVPLTYPQLLGFSLVLDYLASEDCPWPVLGLIHLGNRIEQRESIAVGDVLRVEVCSGRLFAHPKGQVLTVEMKVSRAGVPVWLATQTLLRRGVANPAGPAFDIAGLNTNTAALDAPPLEQLASIPVAADTGRRYARLSGDFNPIHLWPFTAKLFGFRRAIAHGLWSQARAVAQLGPNAAGAGSVLETQFMAPLMLPAQPSLWVAREAGRLRFELRDAKGDRVHFRSLWTGARL